MPGTRIYVDLKVKEAEEGKKTVLFSMKNMSENPLNINADELTERFIRGDIFQKYRGQRARIIDRKESDGDAGRYIYRVCRWRSV